jgi:hypothetical protein
MAHTPPEAILVTEDVGAWYVPGHGPDLAVVFGGIGRDLALPPPIELVGTAHQGGKNHVLALNDMKRTWFSQQVVLSAIRSAYAAVCERVRPAKVIGLGNSMGGYGVILFATEMKMETVIAFAPQFSMVNSVVREPRWKTFRAGFGDQIAESLAKPLSETTSEVWVLHGALGIDVRHYPKFPVNSKIRHAVCPQQMHDIAGSLKARGMLVPFVEAAVDHDVERAEGAISGLNPIWRRSGTQDEIDAILTERTRINAARRGIMLARSRRRKRV